MTKEFFFKDAKWVGAPQREYSTFSILKGTFRGKRGATVTLRALGLGFFKCFVNGILVNPDTFLPLSFNLPASLPTEVVLPTPLTPITMITDCSVSKS